MSTAGGQFKELQYDIRQHGKDTIVTDPVRSEEPIEKLLYDAKKQIEGLIYEFVYDLPSSGPETSKEFLYYCEILSRDDRFMKVVEEIHENRHKGFERGYQYLMAYNDL